MGLPRGRRWVDQPRKPVALAAVKLREAIAAANDPAPPITDAIAHREQLHREADAATRTQGELKLGRPA